ncbi:lytic transglycosylase domain-containing protein (plasmid) [Paracoccus denitrificans]|uniref:lytic transglycosylase domain-containing protein n=1 Tax=Paracoccus denitrificans TaxID=266 RepID=UPI001E3795F9|nr:lytic transglycosylase domain-containing protein [Paracoccus denitrificans]UFS68199.1 lytic transglycosylase domain-containing protein [Paracoccus denitrificans]
MQFRHPFHAAIVFSGQLRAARRHARLTLSGLLLALPFALPLAAEDGTAKPRPILDPLAVHVAEAAQRFDIPEHWIRAVMRVESAGDSTAVSSAGAMGLMQIMPETWAALRIRHGLGDDPFAPYDNILAGAAYMREMLDRYGNTGAMLAAYNAGPGRYDEYLSGQRELPADTRAYVAILAPMLNGDGTLPHLATVAPRASDWREASLFAAPSGDTNAMTAAPDQRGDDAGHATVPPHGALHPIRSEALFVPRSGARSDVGVSP